MPAFYKTVLILETPFWVACAAESVKIGRIGIGASNKSGRRHVGSLAGSSRPLVPFGFAHALLHTHTHTHTHTCSGVDVNYLVVALTPHFMNLSPFWFGDKLPPTHVAPG